MKLSEEDLSKLRTKQVANIIRKLNAGKTVTAREEAILAQERGPEPVERVQTSAPPAESGYAKTQEELAAALGVDRKTIGNVIRDTPDHLPGKKRGAESDGRYCIADWRLLLDKLGIRGRGANNPPSLDERELKLRALKLDLDRKEFELDRAKKSMLPVAEFEAAFGVVQSQFLASLNALPGRAAAKILQRARAAILTWLQAALKPAALAKAEEALGKTAVDFADLEEVLLAEVEFLKATLSKCEYLEPDPDLP